MRRAPALGDSRVADAPRCAAFDQNLTEGLRTERRLFHMTFATNDQKEGACRPARSSLHLLTGPRRRRHGRVRREAQAQLHPLLSAPRARGVLTTAPTPAFALIAHREGEDLSAGHSCIISCNQSVSTTTVRQWTARNLRVILQNQC